MDYGLAGKVAFVSASTAGLGKAIAETLAGEGAAIAVTGRRKDLATKIAEELTNKYGVPTIGIKLDLLDADSRKEALDTAQAALGAIDILILNGPGPRPGGALSVKPEEAVKAAESLIEPHIDLVQSTLPHMREQQWGRIIAVGATSMDKSNSWLTLSGIGRAGLARYLQALAKEIASCGVTINIVQPGIIATERIDALDKAEVETRGGTLEQARQRRENAVPMGRLGTPTEFAAAVAFFASDQARYITGQSLLIDGGTGAAD